jgi:hypothetical protein
MKLNWNHHFQKSQELFRQGDLKKTLAELRVCMKGVEKKFSSIEKLPPEEAQIVALRFSNIIYWRALCFYAAGKVCCARKNIYFAYDQIRSLFLNTSYDAHLRNSLRVELKRITDLYKKNREGKGPDNLLSDFNRIYFTKILL